MQAGKECVCRQLSEAGRCCVVRLATLNRQQPVSVRWKERLKNQHGDGTISHGTNCDHVLILANQRVAKEGGMVLMSASVPGAAQALRHNRNACEP